MEHIGIDQFALGGPVLLRRDAPEPLYLQIKEYLVAEIDAGRLQPDQRIPSERILSQQFNVGRMTVRQALLELMHEGKIYTRMGKGTFVLEPKIDQQLRALTGFSQEMRNRGGSPSSSVLEANVIAALPEISVSLRILPGSDVFMLSRLRLSDEVPLAIETAYLPYAKFPGLLQHNFENESLYQVLEQDYGIKLVQAEQTLEAKLASSYEIEMLSLKPPSPVLKMQRLTYNQEGEPVEYVLSTYRGDRYKFRSTLQTGVTS